MMTRVPLAYCRTVMIMYEFLSISGYHLLVTVKIHAVQQQLQPGVLYKLIHVIVNHFCAYAWSMQ